MSNKQSVRVEFEGVDLRVEGFYSPGRAGTMYTRSGDPGNPPEDPEFECDKVFIVDKDTKNEVCITELLENANFTWKTFHDEKRIMHAETFFERIESACILAIMDRDYEHKQLKLSGEFS